MEETTTTTSPAQATPETLSEPFVFRYKISKNITTDEVVARLTANTSSLLRTRGIREPQQNYDIEKLAKWICGDYKPMLLLCGGTGNGKTTSARALKMLIEGLHCTRMRDAHGNIHIIGTEDEQGYIPSVTMMTAQDIRTKAVQNYDDMLRISKTPFLIIDDAGMEAEATRFYGNEISPIADILYERYERMSFTVLTSNLNRDEIGQRYGARIDSRLCEVMDVINFNGKDYRR